MLVRNIVRRCGAIGGATSVGVATRSPRLRRDCAFDTVEKSVYRRRVVRSFRIGGNRPEHRRRIAVLFDDAVGRSDERPDVRQVGQQRLDIVARPRMFRGNRVGVFISWVDIVERLGRTLDALGELRERYIRRPR